MRTTEESSIGVGENEIDFTTASSVEASNGDRDDEDDIEAGESPETNGDEPSDVAPMRTAKKRVVVTRNRPCRRWDAENQEPSEKSSADENASDGISVKLIERERVKVYKRRTSSERPDESDENLIYARDRKATNRALEHLLSENGLNIDVEK